MKILYVASYEVSDFKRGNGIDHFKLEALRSAGCNVHRACPILQASRPHLASRVVRKLTRILLPKDPVRARRKLLQEIGRAIEAHPYHAEADAIVCPNHFDISFYQGSLPVFFWTDATYQNLVSLSYSSTMVQSDERKHFEHYVQRRAIEKADGALWASHFAMNTAVAQYGADPAKQKVTGFGLNIPGEERSADIPTVLAAREQDFTQLIFIGFDYKRKGLDLAIEATVELNRMGIPAKLDTIGSHHPLPENAQGYVNILGPIDKLDAKQLVTFESALRKAHFFIFPTRGDVYCMPAIEAMSVGCVPVVSDVGGISEIVATGETGIVLPLSASASEYAQRIAAALRSKRYAEMASAGYRAYRERHRWGEIGKIAREFIEQRLAAV
ncbi:glycosyltransferase family 4 protein [Bradyrhizobium guangxiense]|uniref:glycosyltransferase family 4 protein n=1 Tax=Bradyrhizobium guangxiense TaxID=1325115 RepID=UPI0010088BAA|nr:glycosyltransferase family 4 protein [Bradyrhizobium guangxiense]